MAGETKNYGTVSRFFKGKGYGFIKPYDSSNEKKDDVFVHHTGIIDTGGIQVEEGRMSFLVKDQCVEFVVVQEEEGRPKATQVKPLPIMYGTVYRFDDSKGYGFIKPKDGTEDVFVHPSGIKRGIVVGGYMYPTLIEGQDVEFVVVQEGGRKKAIAVKGGPLPEGVDETFSSGIVSGYDGEKGFGFIKPDVGKFDIFVHRSGIEKFHTLSEGKHVEFLAVKEGDDGKTKAIKVITVDKHGGGSK